MSAKTTSLTLNFSNSEAMGHFWRWLSGSGEQQYWEWMKDAESLEEGDITGLEFDYRRADKGSVVVRCGRFTSAPDTEPYDDNDGRNTDWSEDA